MSYHNIIKNTIQLKQIIDKKENYYFFIKLSTLTQNPIVTKHFYPKG